MNNTEISLRREVYKKIANDLSLLNNNQLSELLKSSTPIIADFEVYDERASDPNSTIVDIYVGIK